MLRRLFQKDSVVLRILFVLLILFTLGACLRSGPTPESNSTEPYYTYIWGEAFADFSINEANVALYDSKGREALNVPKATPSKGTFYLEADISLREKIGNDFRVVVTAGMREAHGEEVLFDGELIANLMNYSKHSYIYVNPVATLIARCMDRHSKAKMEMATTEVKRFLEIPDWVYVSDLQSLLKPGDILIFKRDPKDWGSRILSWLVKQHDREWDRWGWHTGFILSVLSDGSIVTIEAKGDSGVQKITYPTLDSLGEVRVYRWFDKLNVDELDEFAQGHLGCSYDLAGYFWDGLHYLLKHLGILTHRVLHDKYTCWELVCDMTAAMGKPLEPIDEFPLISDIELLLKDRRIM